MWHCANERGATGVVDKRHLKLCSDMNAASDDRNQAAPFHFKIECFRERQWRAVGEFQCNADATVRSLLTQIMQHDASLTTKLSLCALYWPEKNKFLQPIAPLRNYAMRRDTLVRLKLFDFYAHFAKLNSGPTRKPTNNNKNNNNNNTNNNNNIIINNNNNSINNTDVAKPITTPSHSMLFVCFVRLSTVLMDARVQFRLCLCRPKQRLYLQRNRTRTAIPTMHRSVLHRRRRMQQRHCSPTLPQRCSTNHLPSLLHAAPPLHHHLLQTLYKLNQHRCQKLNLIKVNVLYI